MISNNPALLVPIKDEQAIDICLALTLLFISDMGTENIEYWLSEMIGGVAFTMRGKGPYPCIIEDYSELLEHPKRGKAYFEDATAGSILYPTIALWAAFLNNEHLFGQVRSLQKQFLEHCTFQFWYPNDESEGLLYTNTHRHGSALSSLHMEGSTKEFQEQIFGECEKTPAFNGLSAVKTGFWPLVLVACRHYRLPVPVHMLQGFKT